MGAAPHLDDDTARAEREVAAPGGGGRSPPRPPRQKKRPAGEQGVSGGTKKEYERDASADPAEGKAGREDEAPSFSTAPLRLLNAAEMYADLASRPPGTTRGVSTKQAQWERRAAVSEADRHKAAAKFIADASAREAATMKDARSLMDEINAEGIAAEKQRRAQGSDARVVALRGFDYTSQPIAATPAAAAAAAETEGAERAAPNGGTPFRPQQALVRISDPLPDPPFLLRGPAPVPFGTAGGLVAEGGTSKSTLTLWEAVHIVLVLRLYGRGIERSGPVLFVSAEDDRATMSYRLQQIARALRLTATQVAALERMIYIEDLTGQMLRLVRADELGNLAPTELGDWLIEAYQGHGLVLINIDPTNLFGPGERFVNDSEAALMVEGQRIAHALGCTVRYVHHTSKMVARGGIVDQYVGRGGAAFADNSRFQHQLVCHRADDAENRLPTLTNPADDFVLKRAAKEGRVLRLHTNKLSWGPRPVAPVWLMRDGFQIVWIDPAQFVSAQAQSAQQAVQAGRRMVGFVQAQLAAGTKLSERQITQEHFSTLRLTRAGAREVLAELLALGHLKWLDLPKEEKRRGGLKRYVAIGDVPLAEDDFEPA